MGVESSSQQRQYHVALTWVVARSNRAWLQGRNDLILNQTHISGGSRGCEIFDVLTDVSRTKDDFDDIGIVARFQSPCGFGIPKVEDFEQ